MTSSTVDRKIRSGRNIAVFFLLLLTLSCSGRLYSTGSVSPEGPLPDLAVESDAVRPYSLCVGDEIEVKFYYHPELNDSTTIRPDGRISLVLVDEVVAEGLTPEQLDEKLTCLYDEKLDRVELTVIVRGYSSQQVFIDGEIKNPQPISLRSKMTVMQAIIAAGGIKDTADMQSVLLIRPLSKKKVTVFRIDIATPDKWAENNPFLKPLDIIYIPKTFIARANLFVQQYLSNMVPDFIRISFPLTYNLGSVDSNDRTVVVTGD